MSRVTKRPKFKAAKWHGRYAAAPVGRRWLAASMARILQEFRC